MQNTLHTAKAPETLEYTVEGERERKKQIKTVSRD